VPGSGDITYKEFRSALKRDRRLGLQVLSQIGRYTPFVFKGERPGDIMLVAGYKVIQDLSKDLNPRRTTEYKAWRAAVLARDEYECVRCGNTEDLHAHHIEPISENLLKALDIDNGETLCEDCHRREHSN